MPPRFAYWTILAGGLPTAFRAAEREDLLPTFNRLRERHPDTELKYFARGRLWASREEAETSRERDKTPIGGRRGKDWRPGGEHRDPRQQFRDEQRAKNQAKRQARWEHKQQRAPAKPLNDAPRPKTPYARPSRTGWKGTPGTPPPSGPRGAAGPHRPSGPGGPARPAGPAAFTRPADPRGVARPTGPKAAGSGGHKGPRGPFGAKGPGSQKGRRVPSGPRGTAGSVDSRPPFSPKGPTSKGQRASTGPKGPRGPRGRNAPRRGGR